MLTTHTRDKEGEEGAYRARLFFCVRSLSVEVIQKTAKALNNRMISHVGQCLREMVLLGRSPKVFDEEKLIVLLVVDELVDHLIGEEDPKAARAQPFLVADSDVVEGVVFGIAHRGVGQLGRIESLPGIFDPVEDGVLEADTGDFNEEVRIKLSTVLNGVVEQFTEGIGEPFPDLFREVGPQLCQQLLEGGDDVEVTRDFELDPVWFGGEDADLWRGTLLEGGPDQRPQVLVLEWGDEQVASLLREGFENDLRALLAAHKNDFDLGRMLSHPRQESRLLPSWKIKIEQDEVDGVLRESVKSAIASGLVKQGVPFSREGSLDR